MKWVKLNRNADFNYLNLVLGVINICLFIMTLLKLLHSR